MSLRTTGASSHWVVLVGSRFTRVHQVLISARGHVTKARSLRVLSPDRLTFRFPVLPAGRYGVEVVTAYGVSNPITITVRTSPAGRPAPIAPPAHAGAGTIVLTTPVTVVAEAPPPSQAAVAPASPSTPTASSPGATVHIGSPSLTSGVAGGAPFTPEDVAVTVTASAGSIPPGEFTCYVNSTAEGSVSLADVVHAAPALSGASTVVLHLGPGDGQSFIPSCTGTSPASVEVTYRSSDGSSSASSGSARIDFYPQYLVEPSFTVTSSGGAVLAPKVDPYGGAPLAGDVVMRYEFTGNGAAATTSVPYGGSCQFGPGTANTCAGQFDQATLNESFTTWNPEGNYTEQLYIGSTCAAELVQAGTRATSAVHGCP